MCQLFVEAVQGAAHMVAGSLGSLDAVVDWVAGIDPARADIDFAVAAVQARGQLGRPMDLTEGGLVVLDHRLVQSNCSLVDSTYLM